MKNLSIGVCFAAGFLLLQSAHADGVDSLSWLSGCWSHEGSDPGSMEMWTPAAAGTLLGVSRTVKNDKTIAHEFMQIRIADNKLAFIAQPSNQPEATFRAIRSSANEVVFENLKHDFPQRVIYRRESEDLIQARIEGLRDGKLRGKDYPMKRTKCETA
jgi:hypothetical protein